MEVPFPSNAGVSVPSDKLILPMGKYTYNGTDSPGLAIAPKQGAYLE